MNKRQSRHSDLAETDAADRPIGLHLPNFQKDVFGE